jgi:hypothetical protein
MQNYLVVVQMEAVISEKLWEISDIVALIPEEAPKKRGSYNKENPLKTLI